MSSSSYDINYYTDILQKIYKANVQRIKDSDIKEDYAKTALIEAEQIWLNVQILMKTDHYSKMNDEQKIDLIQKDFGEFYKNFPIVSRYMICLGQYKMKAFKRMLIKYSETKEDPEPRDLSLDKKERELKNEKQWIERQADYVRFLWEEYQKNSFDPNDSDKVWQHTVDTLSKEFADFRELHEKMEQKVKEDALKHKKELLYEMSERIITGKQSLDDNDTKSLLNKLRDKLFKQRFKKMITQLNKEVNVINPVIEAIGINDYAKQEYDEELQQSYYKKTYKKMDINKIMKT